MTVGLGGGSTKKTRNNWEIREMGDWSAVVGSGVAEHPRPRIPTLPKDADPDGRKGICTIGCTLSTKQCALLHCSAWGTISLCELWMKKCNDQLFSDLGAADCQPVKAKPRSTRTARHSIKERSPGSTRDLSARPCALSHLPSPQTTLVDAGRRYAGCPTPLRR